MVKGEGIILRTVKFGDSSLIADIFTEEYGLKSFVLQSARKAKSQFAPAAIQIMAQVQIDFYDNQNGALHRVKELKLVRFWEKIPLDYPRRAIGLFICEVTYLSLHKFQIDSLLYRQITAVLDFLDTKEPYLDLHIWYLIQLANHEGISLVDMSIGNSRKLQNDYSALKTFSPLNTQTQRHELDEKIVALAYKGLPEMETVYFSNSERKEVLQKLIQHFIEHFDRFDRLKSISVLHDVFN